MSRAGAPRAVTLASSPAAEESYSYSYEGSLNVQVDVLAQHAGRSYLIELDAEPSLGAESRSALELLFKSWRWS